MLQSRSLVGKDLDRMLANVAPETSFAVENPFVKILTVAIFVKVKIFFFIVGARTSVNVGPVFGRVPFELMLLEIAPR